MAKLSLQDQLLKAGLANETKAKQVRAEKRKQTKKQQKNKVEQVNVAQQQLQETKAKQQEKDRLLNEQRNKEAEKKQISNQILQLVNLNKLPKDGEDAIAYNFNDKNTVKTVYVEDNIRSQIIAGKLAIVKVAHSYEVVPAQVAEKISQRDADAVIVLFKEKDQSVDDEYKDYEIPDDLMW